MSKSRKPISLTLWSPPSTVLTDQTVGDLLGTRDVVVAVGVSGGKDGAAAALATSKYLDQINFQGKRLLIHADLGLVEWADSFPSCERLAKQMEWELVTVRRPAGDMMARWRKRWDNNVARYANLECVKLIMPWSSSAMRFCTAEMKRDPICSYLARTYPGHNILSVTGIRREESTKRAKSPISKWQPKLQRKSTSTQGYDWHPILDWTKQMVFDYLRVNHVQLHEAYTEYGSSRVSCAFCILAKKDDLIAASKCTSNREAYQAMCKLEIESTFGFQAKQWLCDIAPHLVPFTWRSVIQSKTAATIRVHMEAKIPEHLLYTKGWPTIMPTNKEADLLAKVRMAVADCVGLDVKYTTAKEVKQRYAKLLKEKSVC